MFFNFEFIFIVFLLLTISFYPVYTASLLSTKNNIYYGNEMINIKGINWFGFETKCNVIHGLWANNIDFYFDFLKENNFNALRVPISYEMAIDKNHKPQPECINFKMNPELKDLTSREILHYVFEKAKENNMFILLDMHTMKNEITPIAELDYIGGWINILPEFQNYVNLLGIDIKNEPHMPETWDHWMLYVKTTLFHLFKIGYEKLYFIEGIQTANPPSGWGNDFSNIEDDNFMIDNNKIVFSPHVYGYSVRGETSITDGSNEFENWFGFLKEKSNNAIVISEFGGFYKDLDMEWHKRLFEYLKKKKIN